MSFEHKPQTSVHGPLPTLNARFAHTVGIAKPWAGARWRFGAAVGACGADFAAVLGFRSRRITRCAHCVRCARTDAASQFTKRARTRADRNPGLAGRAGRKRPAARQARTVHWTVRVRARLLAAAQARHRAPAHGFARQHLFLVGERPQPGIEPGWRLHARLRRAASHGLDARGLPFTPPQERRLPQGGGRGAGGANGAAEKRRAEVGARTRALRDLTHRECSSATNAVSAASFAVRPQTEHRREPSRSEGERRLSPDCAPPAALLAHRPRPSALRTIANAPNGPVAHADPARFMRLTSHRAHGGH